MVDLLTPVGDNIPIGEMIGGKLHGYVILRDPTGADILGLLTASPAANSIGGRLKAIADNTDGIEGFLDQVETLIAATNAALATLNSYNDQVEALLTTGNDAAAQITPARQSFAITPSDTAAITPLPRAVRVNAPGTVTYRAVDSATDVTITALAGEVIPARVQYIRAAGTQATGFVGLA